MNTPFTGFLPSVSGFSLVILFPFWSENVFDHEVELIGRDLPVVVGVVRVEAQTYDASVAVAACSGTIVDTQTPHKETNYWKMRGIR